MFDYVLAVPPDALCSGDAALAVLEQCRQEVNAAAAQLTHAATNLWQSRLDDISHDENACALTASQSATAEVAVTLGCSQASARTLIDTGELMWRLPLVDDAFRAGDLDYAKVRTIAGVLRDAGEATVAAIEMEVLAAAAHLTPGPLRAAIWRAWMRVAPEEAAAVRRDKRSTERKVYVRRGEGGLSWLSACLTDLEGHEAKRLIDELADSVCAADPRSLDNRRADALMALLHGESHLSCRCGDPGCPQAGVEPPRRRGHLLQILVGIETLLGLSEQPATLPDGSPLDPEVMRILAEDATWQALLVEMRTLAGNPVSGVDAAEPAESEGHAAGDPGAVAHGRGRGRTHRPGAVPTPACPAAGEAPEGVGLAHDRAYAAYADGIPPIPNGHGGSVVPPEGALTYRPSAQTADLVRATFATCNFPGCTVESIRCEIDHRVPFDHTDPVRGGWTILENLQPLCKRHHQMKTEKFWTCIALGGTAVLWRSATGVARITVPATGQVAGIPAWDAPPKGCARESFADDLTPDEHLDTLYEPTWWELNMGDAPPPPPFDIELRERYREHRDVARRRYFLQPAPF